eukprot:CAMPEP_0171352516 /NCGR_PEP_ID=MMETSP0878-20121228/41769_1 /TAXON_ID=67004 /ORGANISM="Thalassiosira weissflogii, Strain CCMP1336" /LENGTH=434 /DNA_ID=CAMNT_0011858169 /DNA_START=106 /DNA_END=1410 /DNA_ORIENTATION=+
MNSNQGNSNDSSFATSSDQYRVAGADGQSSKDGTATSAPAGFILPELISDSSEPRPPEQIADFRDLEEGKKVRDKKLDEMQNTPLHPQTTSTSNEFDDVPIPPAQVAAQQETMEENKKKNNIFSASNIVAEAEEPSGTRKSVSPMHLVNSSSTQSANGPTHANDLDNNGSRTHESSEQRHQSNIHLIEATLVVEEPAPPVYNAVLVPGQSDQNDNGSDHEELHSERGKQPDNIQRPNNNDNGSSFWKRHKLAISLGLLAVLLFGGLMAIVGALLAANNGDGNGNGNGSEVGIGALPSFELEPSPEPTYEGSTEEGNLSNDMTDDDVTMSPTSNRGQFSPPSMKPPSNGFTTHPTSSPSIFPESYYSPPSPISRPSKTTSFRPTPSIISNSPTRLHSNSNHSSNWQTNITTNINTTANATSDTTAYTSSNYSTHQ